MIFTQRFQELLHQTLVTLGNRNHFIQAVRKPITNFIGQIFFFENILIQPNIIGIVQQHGMRLLTITACASDLLIVVDSTERKVEMQYQANVGDADSHSERCSSYYDRFRTVDELHFVIFALIRIHIGMTLHNLTRELFGQIIKHDINIPFHKNLLERKHLFEYNEEQRIGTAGRVKSLGTDAITKDYVRDVGIFADIFNFYIYGGRQIIQPEQLVERDSTKIALPYGVDGAVVPFQKFRDVQKLYSVMTDGKTEYVLYGVENQSEVHYAMPVRNNLYDALEYAGQVESAARSHRREMREKDHQESKITPNTGEFLSGFWRRDKLIPSVTLTIFFGSEEWDGPLSLFDMMDVSDTEVLSCIDNYHVHLIAPAQMADEEIMKFQTSLREVMLFIKYSKDKAALNNVLSSNQERFQQLERRAADVIKAATNLGITYEDRKGKVDMCQAVQDMCKESEAIGIAKGIAQGISQGISQGIAQGEAQKAQQITQNLYKMGMELEKIAQGVGYTVETVKQWLNLS